MYEVTIALDIYKKNPSRNLDLYNIPNIPRFNAKLSDKIKTLISLLESDYLNPLMYITGCNEYDCPQIEIKILKYKLKTKTNVSPVARDVIISFSVNNNFDELIDDAFVNYTGKWWEESPFNKQKEDITMEDKTRYLFDLLFSDPVLFFYDMEAEHGDRGDLFAEYRNDKYLFGGEVVKVKDLHKEIGKRNVTLSKKISKKIGTADLTGDISKFLPHTDKLDKYEYITAFNRGKGTKGRGTKGRGTKGRGTKGRGTKGRGTKGRGTKKRRKYCR